MARRGAPCSSRQGQGRTTRAPFRTLRPQGVRAVPVIVDAHAYDPNPEGGVVPADIGHDGQGCRVKANAVRSWKSPFAPAYFLLRPASGANMEEPGKYLNRCLLKSFSNFNSLTSIGLLTDLASPGTTSLRIRWYTLSPVNRPWRQKTDPRPEFFDFSLSKWIYRHANCERTV